MAWSYDLEMGDRWRCVYFWSICCTIFKSRCVAFLNICSVLGLWHMQNAFRSLLPRCQVPRWRLSSSMGSMWSCIPHAMCYEMAWISTEYSTGLPDVQTTMEISGKLKFNVKSTMLELMLFYLFQCYKHDYIKNVLLL